MNMIEVFKEKMTKSLKEICEKEDEQLKELNKAI